MNSRKMRNTKGITLVALIVTIIVLLILAGISLNLIMGEKGITQRAVNAGKTHNIAGAKEKLELQIADYAGEYYQAKYVNSSVDANDVGTYVLGKFSPEETTFEENYYLKKENSKLILTSSDRTTTATCTVDSNGKVEWEGTEIDDDTSQAKLKKVTATEIAANKQFYYGQEVKNYTAGGRTYRIFYVDEAGDFGRENTIYLKADWTADATDLISYASYTPKTTDILEAMNPDWWSNRAAATWNANEHCAAYLCDPTTDDVSSNQAWASYFDSSKANYVIGSPSVEMYVKSYNQVSHPVGNYTLGASYRATSYPGYIYTLDGTISTISNSYYYTGNDTLDYSGYNSMYCGKNGAKVSYGAWLASPSSDSSGNLCSWGGNHAYLTCDYFCDETGLSPLVSLKSGVLPEIEE